jgi:hypothetical protein
MYIERRFVTYCAMLIATLYYFFGKAEASTIPVEPLSICEMLQSTKPHPGD